jgi:hypothetical protein
MADMTVANTILSQLGGRKFIAMTGAKALMGDANMLSFRLPGGGFSAGINYVKVTLNGRDTYDVEFSRISRKRRGWAPAVTLIHTSSDVYADTLRDVFTRVTGLHTSL